jgi:hypothetical protein
MFFLLSPAPVPVAALLAPSAPSAPAPSTTTLVLVLVLVLMRSLIRPPAPSTLAARALARVLAPPTPFPFWDVRAIESHREPERAIESHREPEIKRSKVCQCQCRGARTDYHQ